MLRVCFYKKNYGKHSIPVLRAMNFLELCQQKSIYLGEGELIVGERGPKPKAIPTFPELQKILTKELSIKRSFYLIRHKDDQRVERLNRFAEIFAKKIRLEVQRLEALT